MIHSLGMTAIAEGVERRSQLIYLQAYGCDIIQGFLFSRPLPAGGLQAVPVGRHHRPGARPERRGARRRGAAGPPDRRGLSRRIWKRAADRRPVAQVTELRRSIRRPAREESRVGLSCPKSSGASWLRLGCLSLRSAFASIWRMRSRVTENCWPTSSSVWSVFMPMPKRMLSTRSSRGVSEASTRVVVSRKIDLDRRVDRQDGVLVLDEVAEMRNPPRRRSASRG